MKYKQNLVSGIKKEIAFEKEQEILKEKHHIENPNIVVIEKNNFFKLFLHTGSRVIRLTATILLLVLAAIGLTTIIYPTLRNDFHHSLRPERPTDLFTWSINYDYK